MVQPSQPHLAVVESIIHRPMPPPMGDVPAVDMPATIDVDTTGGALDANRGRLFNNLMAIAKRIVMGAVEASPKKCNQVEAGLHAHAVSVTARPPLQYANPPLSVQCGPLVPNRPHKPKGKGRNLSRSRRLQLRPLLLQRLILDLLRAQLPLRCQHWAMRHFPSMTCRSCPWHC